MFVSKSSVIFFSLLILHVTLKSTQAMPTDIEPREYDEDDTFADDYSFMKNEVDGLREELDDEYVETNDGENVLDERVDDIEDGIEDGDSDDLIGGGLGEGENDAAKEEEEVIYELDGEDDYGEVVGEDEEGEGDRGEKGLGEIFGVDEEGEDQVDEGLGEVVGEDEDGEDQVDEGLGEVVGDNEEGDNDEYQGNVYQKGNVPVDVDGDDDEDDFKDANPRRFPHTWIDKVKEYFKKTLYYLGI